MGLEKATIANSSVDANSVISYASMTLSAGVARRADDGHPITAKAGHAKRRYDAGGSRPRHIPASHGSGHSRSRWMSMAAVTPTTSVSVGLKSVVFTTSFAETSANAISHCKSAEKPTSARSPGRAPDTIVSNRCVAPGATLGKVCAATAAFTSRVRVV